MKTPDKAGQGREGNNMNEYIDYREGLPTAEDDARAWEATFGPETPVEKEKKMIRSYNDIYNFIHDYNAKQGYYLFSRDTLRFFGERVSEMRILKKTVEIKDSDGTSHTCYVLSTLQRNHPGGPCRAHHYFRVDTLQHIIK